jgi:hypothetical protein
MDQHDMQTEKTTEDETVDPHCVTCGMPLMKTEDFGTNSDGSRNEQYCCHCMQGGNLF